MTNTELKLKAFQILSKHLGNVEMEKFIMLIQQAKFDYTAWRTGLFSGLSGKEISHLAMKNRERKGGD